MSSSDVALSSAVLPVSSDKELERKQCEMPITQTDVEQAVTRAHGHINWSHVDKRFPRKILWFTINIRAYELVVPFGGFMMRYHVTSWGTLTNGHGQRVDIDVLDQYVRRALIKALDEIPNMHRV